MGSSLAADGARRGVWQQHYDGCRRAGALQQGSCSNYRPKSIASVSSTVFDRLLSVSNHLVSLSERCVHVPYTAKCIGSRHEARIVQIYFSVAFDMVNHQEILYI